MDVIELLSPLQNLQTIIDHELCREWTRKLFLNDNNALKHEITIWFDIWKYVLKHNDIQKIKRKFKIKTGNPLWNVFSKMRNMDLISITKMGSGVQLNDYEPVMPYDDLVGCLPDNINYIEEEYKPYNICNYNNEILFGFTDASAIDNQSPYKKVAGIGGVIAEHIVTDNNYVPHILNEYSIPLGPCNVIGYAELYGIYELLIKIQKLNYTPHKYTEIRIISDNEIAVKWCGKQLTTDSILILKLIKQIHNIARTICDVNQVSISFQWNERDSNYGIEKADALAKQASERAKECINLLWNEPIFKKGINKNIKQFYVEHDWKQKIDQLKANHLLAGQLYEWRQHIYENYNCIKELDYLYTIDVRILNNLRAGYLKTNYAKHVIKHIDYYHKQDKQRMVHLNCGAECCGIINNGFCEYCHVYDTINHFVLGCDRYINIRRQFLLPIKQLYDLLAIDFNLKNLLFVPEIISATEERRIFHRKNIYQSIVNFVIISKRWNWCK